MSIDKSFLEKIESMSSAEVKEIGGRMYTTKAVHPVIEPEVEPVIMHTLTGLVDFLPTLVGNQGIIVHVKDYDKVDLISNVFGDWKQQDCFAEAKAFPLDFKFGRYLPVEEFIVNLQTMFVQDYTTATIMKVVGNLSQGAEMNVADDGVTQRTTVKAGVARVEKVDLPNPVTLRPYRTFADIMQPECKMVLRIKANGSEGPQAALFEADGGAWKNEAISAIKAWLVGKVGAAAIIVA